MFPIYGADTAFPPGCARFLVGARAARSGNGELAMGFRLNVPGRFVTRTARLEREMPFGNRSS
jgi:hypothetical protein